MAFTNSYMLSIQSAVPSDGPRRKERKIVVFVFHINCSFGSDIAIGSFAQTEFVVEEFWA
jgi:hypothetical protein